jgi:aminopeptidase N
MPSLNRDEAARRANLLTIDSYQIDLDLSGAAEAETFGSTTTVLFRCNEPGAGTFVEVKPVTLDAVTLNGKPLDPADLTDNRLPLRELAEENELVIRATMGYSNTGQGLHKLEDPADGEVYLYANTFLDDAERVFACFDQPDLKARIALTVTAPHNWIVAGNGAETQTEPGRWQFEQTEPISTYLMCLIAGPYHVQRDEHDGIPLGLYCRRSLARHLDADLDELFGITKACLDRYHELFGIRYPFGKYDQAFVPEFNAGAMENAGLVTFRDEFVFRSAVTDAERETRAMVIAHEMAHMWFGDLVTMQWWDDLWLNESFADYMGYRLTAEVTRFTGAWRSFAVGEKGRGYAADQRPSTHPVAPTEVADGDQALLNFDGISYAKGASVLRQLVAWVGDEAFLAGLGEHLRANAFGNATLADLLAALSTASGRDLTAWAEVWLRRAQVNTLRPEVRLGPDGRYEEVAVVQTAPESHPTLRPHRIGIGVYKGVPGGATVVRQRELMVDLDPATDGGRTVIGELAGSLPGDLLLLNDGDLTFAKVRFVDADRAELPRTLPRLVDPLTRALVWAAAADATKDAEMPASEFITLAAAGLPVESELAVFNDVATFAVLDVARRFLAPAAQPAGLAALAGACRAALATAPPGGSMQLSAARGYIRAAGPGDVAILSGWLAGANVPAGLEIDTELRWTVIARLAALGAVTAEDIDAEYERDRSARGAESAALCRAARPDESAKAEAWRVIIEDDTLSNRMVIGAANGFWQSEQLDLTAPYVQRYFDEMPGMAARRSPMIAQRVASLAYPRFAVTAETLAAARAMLARPDLTPGLARSVVDGTDDLERALAARTLS